ncbi:MAG: hypothetical protein KatS3mg029_0233 [Saprospiraceae bacterium]|nr:MAG: hypothetical protein KatS3mg029_0230 [Saprospiraceae bacterium]GIV30882.1 MAG: hypothetical protein KatS3mg029_0233 [Saprospiraceae bacterium]
MKNHLFVLILAATVFAACQKTPTTPSGYKYTLHTHSEGRKGQPGEYAYVHVYIYYDDSLVNTSRNQGRPVPMTIPTPEKLAEAAKGPLYPNPIADVVGMLAVGDSVSVYIPVTQEMKQKNKELENVGTIRYDIVLVDIKNQQEYQQALEAEQKAIQARIEATKAREAEVAELMQDILERYKSGALEDSLQVSGSGLRWLLLQNGNGPRAEAGNRVDVQYYGILPDGKMFDNSFKSGRPHSFTLGRGEVIQGWDEGIGLLNEGSKAVLFIPPALGYGDRGTGIIPPNSELIFYVELEKVWK